MEAFEIHESWRFEAACHESAEIDFFGDDPAELEMAKKVCAGCPVVDECLAYALDTNQTEGVWGGLLPGERNRLRRTWMRELCRAG